MAQAQKGARMYHIKRYSVVEIASVSSPSRYDVLLPRRSAITPVGISNSTKPAVKNALAANASRLFKPASSRKRVLMPQINEAARVLKSWSRSEEHTSELQSPCNLVCRLLLVKKKK